MLNAITADKPQHHHNVVLFWISVVNDEAAHRAHEGLDAEQFARLDKANDAPVDNDRSLSRS